MQSFLFKIEVYEEKEWIWYSKIDFKADARVHYYMKYDNDLRWND